MTRRIVVGLVAAIAVWGALTLAGGAAVTGGLQDRPLDVFVGTTPCGAQVRAFLGGLSAGAECHAVSWRLELRSTTSARGNWTATATYSLPAPSNPNMAVEGPRVNISGTWLGREGTRVHPGLSVYSLAASSDRSLTFARVGGDLIHVLAPDDRLLPGTAGWSYTLNRQDRAEQPDTSAPAGEMSYTISPRATGSAVFGIFEGRTPCRGVSSELGLPLATGCVKVKWRVTLLQDAATSTPTTYKIESSLHRQTPREGKWRIVKPGEPVDPNIRVYVLEASGSESALNLLRADRDILLMADRRARPLVGNADFSYTLNRVER